MRRISWMLTLAAIAMVVFVAAAPGAAVADDPKGPDDPAKEEKQEAEAAEKKAKETEEKVKKGEEKPEKAEEAKKAAEKEKKEAEEKKKKEMPKSGGFDFGAAAFLGLGATVLLVGAGLLVRRSRR